MDRRLFVLGASAWAARAMSQHAGGDWQEGTNYLRVQIKQLATPPTSREAQVVEVFSYTCPHCYRLEPYLQRWIERHGTNLSFSRIHVVWSEHQRAYARLSLTIDLLGLPQLHQAVFSALHTSHRQLLGKDADDTFGLQERFAAENSVDPKKFATAYRSAAVDDQLKQSADLLGSLPIDGTPTLLINNTYLTDPAKLQPHDEPGVFEQLIALADFLLTKNT